jgi:MFS family permease
LNAPNDQLPDSDARIKSDATPGWYLVGLMWGAFVLNYVDRQVVFSIFPVLSRDLHFSSTELGLIGSVFTWTYSLAMPVAGRIGDIVRRERLIVSSLVLWSLATYGTGIAGSVPAFLLWRGAMGISESLFMPAALGCIAALHTGGTRSRALSLFATGQFAGVIAGGSWGGWMADHVGWRTGFTILASAGICYAAFLFIATKKGSPGRRRKLNAGSDWHHVFAARCWLVLCVSFIFYCAMLWILLAWLADFIHSRYGLSLTASGISATVFLQVGLAVGVILGGILGDRFARRVPGGRFYVAAIGLLICAPFATALLAVDSLALLRSFSAVFGVLGGLFVANLYASAYDVIDETYYSFAAGLMNFLGGIAGGLAVFLTGALKDHIGIAWLTGAAAAGALASGVALMLVTKLFFHRDQARTQKAAIQDGTSALNLKPM